MKIRQKRKKKFPKTIGLSGRLPLAKGSTKPSPLSGKEACLAEACDSTCRSRTESCGKSARDRTSLRGASFCKRTQFYSSNLRTWVPRVDSTTLCSWLRLVANLVTVLFLSFAKILFSELFFYHSVRVYALATISHEPKIKTMVG